MWHHVAGAYDGTEYKLYIDGRTSVSVASSGILKGDATAYYGTIGAHYKRSDGAPKFFFNGLIDDVRLYDRALSEAEIRQICCVAPKAYGPSPADCTFHGNTWINLEWSPGYAAISHDVYFGENFDDVNDGTGGTFQGSQTETFFVVGFPGHPYPDGLVPGTTYYWRIDEVVAARVTTIYKGDVWSFKIYAIENVEGAEFFDDFEDEVIDPFWVILTDNDCPASQVRETIGVLTINVPANLTDYCDTGLKTAMSHSWKRFEASVDFRVPQGNSMAWLTAVVHPDNGRDSGYWCVYYFDQGWTANYYTWHRNNENYGRERCMRAFGDESTAWHTFKLTYDAETMIANAYVDDIFLNSKTVDLTNFRISISTKAPAGIPASTVEFDNFRLVYAGPPDLYDDGELYRSFSPNEVKTGEPFSIHCRVRNGGDEDSGPFKVRFYASRDKTIAPHARRRDYFIGEAVISSIPAGAVADCDWNGPFPTGIEAGEYYVGWIIDADDVVREFDEANNTAYIESPKLIVEPRTLEPLP